MKAALRHDMRQPEVAARPPILSLDKVGLSVPLPSGRLDILDNVSLDVRDGEFLSIIGGSGCGKTTLLRLVGGLSVPTSGKITFEGAAVDHE